MNPKNLIIVMEQYTVNSIQYKVEKELISTLSSFFSSEQEHMTLPIEANFDINLQYSLKKDLTSCIVTADAYAEENVILEKLPQEMLDDLPQVEDGKWSIRTINLNLDFMFNLSEEWKLQGYNSENFHILVDELNKHVHHIINHIVADKIRQITATSYSDSIKVANPDITVEITD